MSFTLRFNNVEEKREISKEYYTIKDLLEELDLSSQIIVSKKNGELVIEDELIHDGDKIHLVQIIYWWLVEN